MSKFKKTSYMAALSLLAAALFLASPKPVFGKEDNPGQDKKTSSQGKKGSPPGLEDFELPELPDQAKEHLPELPPQVPDDLEEAFREAASPST